MESKRWGQRASGADTNVNIEQPEVNVFMNHIGSIEREEKTENAMNQFSFVVALFLTQTKN